MIEHDDENWARALEIDAATVSRAIAKTLKHIVRGRLARRGLVVGLSGGVDSSVVAALAVEAVGRRRVLALLMPERDSSPASLVLGLRVARQLDVEHAIEDITTPLAALGAYQRTAEALRQVFPDYEEGWKHKLVLPSVLKAPRLTVFQLVVEDPRGVRSTARLSAHAYAQLVAATNLKQRTRKVVEYYHAERRGYAVAGTPNRLEYDQGFFVKYGDGAADVKPIAHLYKSQVYALAEHLGLPPEVRSRQPATDAYPLAQAREELYFPLPSRQMDLCLLGHNLSVPADAVARAAGLTPDQVLLVWRDIELKRRATQHLHAPPILACPVPEVETQSYGVSRREWRYVERA